MNDAEIRLQVKLDDSTAKSSIDSMTRRTENLQKVFTNAGKKLTIGLTVPIAGLVATGVKYNAELEQFEAGLTALLGSADEAKKLLNDLKKMAALTPFETTDLIEATQTMLSYGISLEDTQEALGMLGDVSMGNSEKLRGLALVFGQIQSTGRLTGQDLLQLINQGFNPLTIISQQTGRSMKDLKKDMENGAISADMVTEAFKTATSEGGLFFGAMDKQSQTTSGKISTLKDSFKEATGALTESLLPVLEDGVELLTRFANWFTNLDEKQKKNILVILGIVAAIGPLLIIVSKAIGLFQSLAMISTALNIGMLPLIGTILLIVAAIVAVGVVIYQVIKHWDVLKQVFSTGIRWWGNLFNSVFKGIGNAFIGLINLLITGLNYFMKMALLPINTLIKGINIPLRALGLKTIKTISLSIPKIPYLEVGTNYVSQEGLAYLHEGEAVVPKKYNPAIGGNLGQEIAITVQMPDIMMDDIKIGKAITPTVTKIVKLSGGNI